MVEKIKPRFFYGWIIVAVLVSSMMLGYATRTSFAVFYVAILDDFGWTRSETAGIFSLSLIVYGVGGIISGLLLDKLGPRKLFPMAATLIALGALWCSRATAIWEFYVAFGVLIAFGQCSLGYVPAMTMVNHWFVKRRGLAIGIVMLGFSLSFFLSLLTQYLRETVGWRIAFVVFAIAIFVVIVPLASIFMRHRPQDIGLLPDGAKEATETEASTGKQSDASILDHRWTSVEWTLLRALKTYRLWFIFAVSIMMGIIVNFPQVHQVALITDIGYSAMFAVAVFTVFGFLNGAGPLGGFFSDRLGREAGVTLGVAITAIGITLGLLIQGPGMEWGWYLYVISYGLGMAVSTPAVAATYGDLFAGRHLGSIIGFINMGFGAGGAIGPYLAGYIYDVTGSYTLALIMLLVAACGMIILMWLTSPRKIRLVAGRIPKESSMVHGHS